MKRILLYLAFAALSFASCIQDVVYELPDGDKFDNVYIVQAVDNPHNFMMKSSFEGTVTKSISAFYSGYVAPKTIHLTFEVDPSLLDAYVEETGIDYVLLPESAYDFPVKEAVIKEGENHTPLLDVNFHVSPEMELFVNYVLPIRVTLREKDIKLRQELEAVYFTTGLTKDFSPLPVDGKIDNADEIFSFNDKCIIAHNNATGELIRYPYDPDSHTVGTSTVLINPSVDPYWGSSYARFVFPCRNSIHLINIYGYWIGMPVNEDATSVGLIAAGQYSIMTGGCSIVLQCIPNQHSAGEMLIDMATGGIRNYLLTEDGLTLTGALGFKQDFNFWPYKLRFCYKDDIYGVDSNGNLWFHAYNPADYTFSSTPEQVGEGWGDFTHIIPFGDDLLCRKSDGSLLCFAYDPSFYWDIKDLD